MISLVLRRYCLFLLIGSALGWITCTSAQAQDVLLESTSIIREIRAANERQEMTVNTSRILTLSPGLTEANRIPRAQVNDEAILDLTALSATQIQIAARKPGVTQVNLWDENGKVYTVDVIVYGDSRELSMLLKSQFPNASLKVVPVSNGVLISGYVDQPSDIQNIMRISEEYYPNVLDNIRVGGVHQVLLHVKAMEVSRTKLRSLGFDWTVMSNGDLLVQGVSGLIGAVTKGAADTVPGVSANAGATMKFDLINGSSAFFGVLEALRQDNLAKVLAEPTLVTSSGRPAFFHVGGEVPYLVPQGLGTTAIEYKEYGTRVDFVPIVLGNGKIRLEVRPRVSDIDTARSIVSDGQIIYAFTKHEVDTGVQMQAGQTLAIAGLVQNRVESTRRGVPWVSDVPYLGAAFRRVEEKNNEIELLIFVTPELVDAMDAHEVPPCGPGMRTASPRDCELYLKGYIEVPRCCPPGSPGTQNGQPVQMFMPEQSLSPDEILTPTPSMPPAPMPSVTEHSSVSSARQNRSVQKSRPSTASRPGASGELPGFMGPIGYDSGE